MAKYFAPIRTAERFAPFCLCLPRRSEYDFDALSTAVCSAPTSMHVAQLALSVNMEAATATAISEAAIAGPAEKTDANMAIPATA